jgi:hypothetical protein
MSFGRCERHDLQCLNADTDVLLEADLNDLPERQKVSG